MTRGPVEITLDWGSQPLSLRRFVVSDLPAGGGLYIVMKDGVPIYVGKAGSFQFRWGGRLQALYQIGMIDRVPRTDGPVITVWFGRMLNPTGARVLTAEHAAIRLLRNGLMKNTLRNQSSIQEFLATGIIEIVNPVPRAIADTLKQVDYYHRGHNRIRLGAQTKFEFVAS